MNWQTQHEKAKNYPYQLVPGQAPPTEGKDGGQQSSDNNSSSSHHLGGGAIAGIVVGVVAFVAILVILFFVLGRNRVYRQWMSSQGERSERTARWAFFGTPGDQTWSTARKSGVESGVQPMSEHPPSFDSTQVAMSPPTNYNPCVRHSSPPPPGVWSWDMSGIPQEHNQPPPPPPPAELDGSNQAK